MPSLRFFVVCFRCEAQSSQVTCCVLEQFKKLISMSSFFRHSRAGPNPVICRERLQIPLDSRLRTLCTSSSDVGWVERSETHHIIRDNTELVGFATLYPPYE